MKSILKTNKKAQLRVENAPGVVLIVLFLFMVLGTSAFVLGEYQTSFSSDETQSITDEVVTQTELNNTVPLDKCGVGCNPERYSITSIVNTADGYVINSGNYTFNSNNCSLTNSTATFSVGTWNVNYTYKYSGIACNVTRDLSGEVESNVSIAGMILTISLIGIILSILIGLFTVFTRRRGI